MADISVTGTQLALSFAGIVLLMLGVIFFMRNRYSKKAETGFASSGAAGGIKGRNKYPGANPFSLSGTFFNLGLALALGIVALAFGLDSVRKRGVHSR
jgi:protein TonB